MMEEEDSLRSDIDEVESQLILIEHELESLLQKQQELLDRKQLLKTQLDSIQNVQYQEEKSRLESTNWESGSFPWSAEVSSTLKSYFKLDSFRHLQLSCINATLAKKDVILVMPTGGGKSLCYQLPAILSDGVTLVVSPLVSLMEDQMIAVKSFGIESSMLNASSSRGEANTVKAAMVDKKSSLKLLYVTPEKIARSKQFMSKLEKAYEIGNLSRIVIDEVHCTSQWGHNFRPDYKFLGVLKRQFPGTPILGLTATATAKVLADCQDMLSLKHCLVFRASYNRPNLFYEVRAKASSHKAQMEELAGLIKSRFTNQSGIVYCFSRKDSEQVCLDLGRKGIKAGYYHADMPSSDRTRVHMQWLNNALQVIVATVAFGMGIDKPNVRFVIHHSISKSMENYYQESGRAGRDGDPAHCIVFYRSADAFRQSTMVFTEHTGLQNLYSMLRYCLNETDCRRSFIARSFGEKWKREDCESKCDVCQEQSPAAVSQVSHGSSSVSLPPPNFTELDISLHCCSMIGIIERAKVKNQRLTGLKLVETWKGKSSSKSEGKLPLDKCERVLVHAVLEGVLKEEFHFTPYSTISYIGLGRKSLPVQRGKLKITMKTVSDGVGGGREGGGGGGGGRGGGGGVGGRGRGGGGERGGGVGDGGKSLSFCYSSKGKDRKETVNVSSDSDSDFDDTRPGPSKRRKMADSSGGFHVATHSRSGCDGNHLSLLKQQKTNTSIDVSSNDIIELLDSD